MEKIDNITEENDKAIISSFSCPCRPGFQYKTKNALDAHRKTKMHLGYEKTNDLKNTMASSKKLENEMEAMKLRLKHKENIETQLLERINQLEYENKWLVKQLRIQNETDQVNALIQNKFSDYTKTYETSNITHIYAPHPSNVVFPWWNDDIVL